MLLNGTDYLSTTHTSDHEQKPTFSARVATLLSLPEAGPTPSELLHRPDA
jgi:hypothetical protein